MGLEIAVGSLAYLRVHDPEGADFLRKQFAAINELLKKHGLPEHREPEKLSGVHTRCETGSFPYSYLHYLRRVYAHVLDDASWEAEPLSEGENPADDEVLIDKTNDMESHLLCHSDAEGFYVPLDFDEVLFDDGDTIAGAMVGSSYRLWEELYDLAPALGIELTKGILSDEAAAAINEQMDSQEGLWIERMVWLSLFDASRISIERGTAICFC